MKLRPLFAFALLTAGCSGTSEPATHEPGDAAPDGSTNVPDASTHDVDNDRHAPLDAGGNTMGLTCSTRPPPSYTADVLPILNGCAGNENCHGPFQYSTLVDASSTLDGCGSWKLVVKNDLEASYLLHKVTGIGMCPSTQKMPPGSTLANDKVQTLVDWICSGAPKN